MIILVQPKAVSNFVPLCAISWPLCAILCHFVPYVTMRTVYRGRVRGTFLKIFKCRVIKIINCCHGKCGGSRSLRGCRVGRGRRLTHYRLRAAAGADADSGKSAPRIANGPRFATPGAGRIVKEQMHAQSIQPWLNLLQRALYPHNTQRISAPLRAGRELASQVQSLVALSASVGQPGKGKRKENGLGVVPTPFLSTESTEENRLSPGAPAYPRSIGFAT